MPLLGIQFQRCWAAGTGPSRPVAGFSQAGVGSRPVRNPTGCSGAACHVSALGTCWISLVYAPLPSQAQKEALPLAPGVHNPRDSLKRLVPEPTERVYALAQ